MQHHAESTQFNDRWLRIIGMPLIAVLTPPIFFTDTYLSWNGYWQTAGVSLIFTIVIWEGNRFIYKLLARRFPAIEETSKRLILLVVVGMTFSLVACSAIHGILEMLLPHVHETKEPTFFQKNGASLVLLVAVSAIYESMHFFHLWRKTLLEKEQVQQAHLSSQLDGLRNQVNPHFLFNSLNTLTYLIPEDPARAVRFVQQLSKVYRYVLESRDAQVIPLATELEFLQAYMFLLRERFGDNLHFDVADFSEKKQHAIVPLSLQMLFENAIKHNVISAEKPLTISVFEQNGNLVVRNNFQRKNQVMDSTGVGLDNIRSRYRMLSGREVEVIVSPKFFTVLLPLIEISGIEKIPKIQSEK